MALDVVSWPVKGKKRSALLYNVKGRNVAKLLKHIMLHGNIFLFQASASAWKEGCHAQPLIALITKSGHVI